MEPTLIPKLERDQIGVWDKMGWYLAKHELYPSKDVVIFQCKFGHGGRVPAECIIGRDGIVSPGIRCHCLKFAEPSVLDQWPDWFYKLAGKEDITKFFAQANLNK